MNLRFLAPAALFVAVASLSSPARADLVISSQGPSANKSQGRHQQALPVEVTVRDDSSPDGVIEFSTRPSNTVVRPAGNYNRPSGSPLHWVGSNSSGASQNAASPQNGLIAQGGNSRPSMGSTGGMGGEVVVASQNASLGRVIEVGRERALSSDLTVPVRGWADEVPLEMALSQVIPGDWSIQARGVKLNNLISWRGDKPWVEVLSEMTRQGRFNANVVWDRKVVVVFPAGGLDGTALSPLPAKHGHVSSAHTVPAAPLVKTWKIDPRLTLRGNIEAWTKQAGWNTVVWEAADYPIVAPSVLSGEFASPTGPLAKLIDAYRDSDQPLEVSLSTMDKVVHVTNKNYDAPTVAPLTPQVLVPHVFDK